MIYLDSIAHYDFTSLKKINIQPRHEAFVCYAATPTPLCQSHVCKNPQGKIPSRCSQITSGDVPELPLRTRLILLSDKNEEHLILKVFQQSTLDVAERIDKFSHQAIE